MSFLSLFKILHDERRADKDDNLIYVAPKFKMVMSAIFVFAWLTRKKSGIFCMFNNNYHQYFLTP